MPSQDDSYSQCYSTLSFEQSLVPGPQGQWVTYPIFLNNANKLPGGIAMEGSADQSRALLSHTIVIDNLDDLNTIFSRLFDRVHMLRSPQLEG